MDFTTTEDVVFDPFSGSGTVPYVCKQLGRKYIACEVDEKTGQKANQRLKTIQGMLINE